MGEGLKSQARDRLEPHLVELPAGRPLEIVVDTAGESTEETDVLELIRDGETHRRIFLKAADWVPESTRSIHAVAAPPAPT